MNNETKSSARVWFVTGASKGLGRTLVLRLIENGARVAATTRSRRALAASLGDAGERALAQGVLLPLEVDLLSEASVGAAVAETVRRFGRLDVVVNNAGYGQTGALEEVSDQEARADFDVNVFGLLNVVRATVPHLRAQRSGRIFNIASIGGFVGGFPGWGIYCATKFAVAGLSEGLQAELEEHGVGVTVVYPGYFRTDFLAEGSLRLPANRMDAYRAVRATEDQHTQQLNHAQPGDPVRLADALIEVVRRSDSGERAPFHLFLGGDAVDRARAKLDELRAELDTHEALSRSTNLRELQ